MDNRATIRIATLDDPGPIAALCLQLGYEADAQALGSRLAYILGDPRQAVFVADLPAARVVGWVHAFIACYLEAKPFAEIGGVVVDATCRRLGIGRRLMVAVEGWARNCGVRSIRVRSSVVRAEAHAFYESIGYCMVKEQYTFSKDVYLREAQEPACLSPSIR